MLGATLECGICITSDGDSTQPSVLRTYVPCWTWLHTCLYLSKFDRSGPLYQTICRSMSIIW